MLLTGALWALASLTAGAPPDDPARDAAATCVVNVTSPQGTSSGREHLPTFSATKSVNETIYSGSSAHCRCVED